jgi:pilus assembly protein Flp/PilA
MTALYIRLANRLRGEEGATAVEYGLFVALIAAVIIGTVNLVGDEILAAFEDVLAGF